MAWGILVKTHEDIFLQMCKEDGKWVIQGFERESEGLRFFERGYSQNHGRGYEASMSACIFDIQYSPRIVELDLETIQADLLGDELRLKGLSSVAGHMTGLVCAGPKAAEMYETGSVPRLTAVA